MCKNYFASKILPRVLVCFASLVFIGCLPPDGQIFSFVVIADPHVSNGTDNAEELEACVEWINDHHEDENKSIQTVFVVGDMGGSRGSLAKAILDDLTIPYVPLIGDNDVHWSGGGEENDRFYTGGREFNDTFGDVFDELASVMENWNKAPTPVWNPEIGTYSYLHNFSFDVGGVHFTCLDWCTRKNQPTQEDPLQTEQADLHDFQEGTWQWFTDDITQCNKDAEENIVMLSHHPMHIAPVIGELPVNLGAFDHNELDQVESFTAMHGSHVYANISGHYHINWYEARPEGGYEVYVAWGSHTEPSARMKLVRVYRDNGSFFYDHTYILPEIEQNQGDIP